MSPNESIEHTASSDDLYSPHPDDQLEESDDDVVTSYNGSGPSSPIQSFSQPSQFSNPVHPDNSQFSMVATVGTPNILHAAHSNVTALPSLIRDARLAAAPYSTLPQKVGSTSSSRQSSAPTTRPPSRGPPLPTMAAAFGLKTTTVAPPAPLSLVPETPAASIQTSIPQTTSPTKVYPEINKVSVEIPPSTSAIPGIVLHEWAVFQKHVIDYNLSCELYKLDLDWKKANPREPQDSAELAEYHLHIGRVNQRVGAIALMEHVIGQYIQTVGPDIVLQQAQQDHLALTKSNIDWLLQQGAKDTSKLLQDDGVPQEDLAPALFLPSLQATPAPSAPLPLPADSPPSPLSTLTPSTMQVSPSVSALATPLTKTFDQLDDQTHTPKATPMDISLPTNAALPDRKSVV